MEFVIVYVGFSICLAVLDLVIANKSFQQHSTMGAHLGYSCLCAAVVELSYLGSILSRDYLFVSVSSSIYFLAIDVLLNHLILYVIGFTDWKMTTGTRISLKLLHAYCAFDIVVLLINPFQEIAISYVPQVAVLAHYTYRMMPLYWMHLIYAYIMVIMVLFFLLHKTLVVPKEYRWQYQLISVTILVVVGVNVLFLFMPETDVLPQLDYSIWVYSLVACFIYWGTVDYSRRGMLNRFKTVAFENIDQGIVLFDYRDVVVLCNQKADHLLTNVEVKEGLAVEPFLQQCGITASLDSVEDGYSLQCYQREGDTVRPLRCDYRRLKNQKGDTLGRLFVFSDAELETDLLTSFHNWESFFRLAQENPGNYGYPTAVAICDINSLSLINSTRGQSDGDRMIKHLADALREVLPQDTYFVRGQDANLIALCYQIEEEEVKARLEQLQQSLSEDRSFFSNIQYAVSVPEEGESLLSAIQRANLGMRSKKLLDRDSAHSAVLTSLIRAMQECDSDTQAHVARTQKMGARLGKRLGLSDVDQSKLALLCILHDIGKVGVPLEVLNKPGKLTESELRIMQTHVEKGYQIAKSTRELSGIADMIRYHHERWDGKGYPDGLSRESIPLLSRVIAVVDAYDAMVNDRVYRRAMTPERAQEELRRHAGTQFDPLIVSEFLRMLQEESTPGENHEEPLTEPEESEVEILFPDSSLEGTDTLQNVHLIQYSRYLLDEELYICSADEMFEELTGYPLQELQLHTLRQYDLIPEEDRTEYMCLINEQMAQGQMAYFEHRLLKKDGSIIYVFGHGRRYYDALARTPRIEILLADSASTYSAQMLARVERSKAQARLERWESTYRRDSLTGLLSHAAFMSDVEIKLLSGKNKVMMLMIDLDMFKAYNDTYGHHAGDEFLIQTAQALTNSLRKDDLACRMGGDEFAAAIFFPVDASDELMGQRGQQIFDRMSLTLRSAKEGTSISMGGAVAEAGQSTFNQLYEAADQALYRAKEQGRGRFSL